MAIMASMQQDSGINVNIQTVIDKLRERLSQATLDLVIAQCGNDALLAEREQLTTIVAEQQAQLAAYEGDQQTVIDGEIILGEDSGKSPN